jgi:hypothetical protein
VSTLASEDRGEIVSSVAADEIVLTAKAAAALAAAANTTAQNAQSQATTAEQRADQAILDAANALAAANAALAESDGNPKLNLTGGTLTGFLTLHDLPVNPNHAATKAYADFITTTSLANYYPRDEVYNKAESDASYLTSSAPTVLLGHLTLALDGTEPMHAITYRQAFNALNFEAEERVSQGVALVTQINSVTAAFQAADSDLASDLATTQATIISETTARADADSALAFRATTLEAQMNNTAVSGLQARIANEETARVSADGALASQITTITADYQAADAALLTDVTDNTNALNAAITSSTAAITNEATTRANADAALASQITTVAAEAATARGVISAQLTSESTARATADTALASDVNVLTAEINNARSGQPSLLARITQVNDARVSGDQSLSSRAATLEAQMGNTAASGLQARISNEEIARASADSALSSQVSTLSTTVNGNTASISTQQSSINGINVQFGVTGFINGSTGGFQFTGVQRLDGSVSFGFEIDANVIVNGSITAAKIAAGSITADRITVGTITADRIVNLGIDTARIANNAVSNSGAIDAASSVADKVMNFFARAGDVITIHAVIVASSSNNGWTWALRLNGSNIYASPTLLHGSDIVDRWFAVTAGFTGTQELRATLVSLGENISLRAYALAVSK